MPPAVALRMIGIAAGLAIGVGVTGDILLRPGPWGLGFSLWIVAASAGAAWLGAASGGVAWWTEARWYLPAAFFAGCLGWRDAEVLTVWNVLGTGAALLIPTLRARGVRLVLGPLGTYVLEPIRMGLGMAFGPLVVAAEDVEWQRLRPAGQGTRAIGVGIGILLALPVALVFGALLASADPVFERVIRWLFNWDYATLVSHTVVIVFLSWIAAGYLFALLGRGTPSDPLRAPAARPVLGPIELGIPLGVLATLFLTFVVIQARYLFGGEALVQATVGMTYAEYARRGFFELIAVAGLLLPLLLAADWLLDAKRPAADRGFRALASLLLILTLPIVASALERMRLYVDAYGLTTDRVYALAVMIWVLVSLAWFAFTVLGRNRNRFAFGTFVAGLSVLALLNAVNPHRIVAQVNLTRADRGFELDAAYLLRLDGDALPAVLAGLPARHAVVSCSAIQRLRQRWEADRVAGWRRWSLGRSAGRQAVSRIDPAWVATCLPDGAATDRYPGAAGG